MPKMKKPMTRSRSRGIHQSLLGSDDETLYDNEELDEDDDDDDDEVEAFHKEKDSHLFKRSSFNQNDDDYGFDQSSEEEVLALESDDDEDEDEDDDDGGDDDDDENDYDAKFSKFEIEHKKDEMASDLEDDDDEDGDGLPHVSAWGKKKSTFYNTDYVDKDFRTNKESDDALAKYEEEEALAIQKRLLESMSDVDLGMRWLIGDNEAKFEEANKHKDQDKHDDDDEEQLEVNFSALSKREKKELLKKDSPELMALIKDFITFSNEIKSRLEPVLMLINNDKIPHNLGVEYIKLRYQLIINYCINISFYMILKSKRIPIRDHPVIKQLLAYKKLLNELDVLSSNKLCSINDDIDLVLKKLELGEDIQFNAVEQKESKSMKRKTEAINSTVKKVKFADKMIESKQIDDYFDDDNFDDDNFDDYNFDDNLDDNEVINDENEEEQSLTDEALKRGITYEIAKNKGLTPRRKKELRNPRVKHRMKYRKAKIRRKGQVREPRKELQRYGGEFSGIKSTTVKSIKFK